MIYEIEKGEEVFEIDDLILFQNQPEKFKTMFDTYSYCQEVIADNAIISVTGGGRVLISLKNLIL